MSRIRPCAVTAAVALITLTLLPTPSSAIAVMSVDLGSEWMKVAVVTPGVPMEIAMNPESKRKTSVAVAMRDGERMFGGDAVNVGVKAPKKCYFYFLDLVGKKFDHPQVKLFRERFPYYEMKPHPERGTVLFQHDEDTTYTPEELLAMVLEHARRIARDFTEQKVKDAVITVPAYFGQAERRAVKEAAKLAGINCLQLISEPMAVSLNYGMFRRKEINGTVKHMMFYDMGSQDTTVSIVSYQIVKTKERGFTETHPQAQVLGIGYERNLGGLDLQIKIRDHLAKKFNEMGKTKTDVWTVPRAMGKLLKEAGKVKNVLSANTQTYAQIENVMEDIDFKVQVTRDTFHELNKDFFEKVTKPIDMALATFGGSLDEISEVILVGGGTRVPKVQELLVQHLGGRELGKNLNTDESAAMGAVYRAAELSTGFKVKKFLTKEGVLFPIDVDFERPVETDEGKADVKQVRRSLFTRMNPFPQKKIMTFNKHTAEFDFNVKLGDLEHLGEEELANVGTKSIATVHVMGVAEALAKHADNPKVETKGVKAHFHLDESGLINITSIESVFERTITVEEQEEAERKEEGEEKPKAGEDGSWLGDTISNFFNKESENEEGKNEEDGEKTEEKTKEKEEKKEEKEGSKDEKTKKEDKKKEEKKKEEKKKPKKPKVETYKEELTFKDKIIDLAPLSQEELNSSKEKLKALNKHDELKKKRETALNGLESFVIDVRDKMYQEVWEDSVTDEEKEKIPAKCSEISDWIDEDFMPDTEIKILEEKLGDLKVLTAPWFARVREHLGRPEALEALDKTIENTVKFHTMALNETGDTGFFAATELQTLQEKLSEVQKWRDESVSEQDKQPKQEMPKLTMSAISEKAQTLDFEIKYLVNKAKMAKRKAEEEAAKKVAEEKKAKEEEEKKKKKAEKKKKKEAAENNTETTEDDGTETTAESVVEEPLSAQEEVPEVDPTSEVPETDDGERPVSDGGSEIPEVMEESPKEETKDSEKEETESDHTEL